MLGLTFSSPAYGHTLTHKRALKHAVNVTAGVGQLLQADGATVLKASVSCRRRTQHVFVCTPRYRTRQVLTDGQGNVLPGSPELTLTCRAALRVSQRSKNDIVRLRVPASSTHCLPSDGPPRRQPRPTYRRGDVIGAHGRDQELGGRAAVFGQHPTFENGHDRLLQSALAFFGQAIPQAGGQFASPTILRDVQDNAKPSWRCTGGGVDNLAYCPTDNVVAWAAAYSRQVWGEIGDAAWAGPLAHEFGHGSEVWLGFYDKGAFRWVLAKESFADCMAGAWAKAMFDAGNFDTVGRGDLQEIIDWYKTAGEKETTWKNHGTYEYRMGAFVPGWNYGFGGCVRYGQFLSTHDNPLEDPAAAIKD